MGKLAEGGTDKKKGLQEERATRRDQQDKVHRKDLTSCTYRGCKEDMRESCDLCQTDAHTTHKY